MSYLYIIIIIIIILLIHKVFSLSKQDNLAVNSVQIYGIVKRDT